MSTIKHSGKDKIVKTHVVVEPLFDSILEKGNLWGKPIDKQGVDAIGTIPKKMKSIVVKTPSYSSKSGSSKASSSKTSKSKTLSVNMDSVFADNSASHIEGLAHESDADFSFARPELSEVLNDNSPCTNRPTIGDSFSLVDARPSQAEVLDKLSSLTSIVKQSQAAQASLTQAVHDLKRSRPHEDDDEFEPSQKRLQHAGTHAMSDDEYHDYGDLDENGRPLDYIDDVEGGSVTNLVNQMFQPPAVAAGGNGGEPPQDPNPNGHQNDAFLGAIAQDYDLDTDIFGGPINENLTTILKSIWAKAMSEDKLKTLCDKFLTPENCQCITSTKINPELWSKLSTNCRSNNIRSQRVQSRTVKGLLALTILMDKMLTAKNQNLQPDLEEWLRLGLDSFALVTTGNQELNQRRKDQIKPELNHKFKALCSPQLPVTDLLFGDIQKSIKDISEGDKLSNLAGYQTPSRGRGRGCFPRGRGRGFRQSFGYRQSFGRGRGSDNTRPQSKNYHKKWRPDGRR